MENKVNDLINQYNGKPCILLPKSKENKRGECFDVALAMTDLLGVPHFPNNPSPFPVENATEIFTNFTDWQLQYFDKIDNAAENFPLAGDIVIFGKGINHVVVATEGSNKDILQCFSQNDPLFSACILKEYDYSHVLGWLHYNPKMYVSQSLYTQLVANSTAYDFICDTFKIARNSGLDRVSEAISTRNDYLIRVEQELQDEHALNKTLIEKIQILSNIPVVASAHPEVVSEPVVVAKPQPAIPLPSIENPISLNDVIVYYFNKLVSLLKGILIVQLPKK